MLYGAAKVVPLAAKAATQTTIAIKMQNDLRIAIFLLRGEFAGGKYKGDYAFVLTAKGGASR